jgi:hypothetical protein
MPEGFSISSYATYHDTLVLCCYKENSISIADTFSLLSYRPGDASFSIHPIVIAPYEYLRTSLQVVNDTLYLFHTRAAPSETYQMYRSLIEPVYTNNWTLGEQKSVYLPNKLAPGVKVSDGQNLYVIGGLTSNTTPPYRPAQTNDTIFRVDVTTGKVQTVAEVPGASTKNCFFIGNDLVMMEGGFTGSAQTNYGWVTWDSTVIYHMANGTLTVPESPSPLSTWGPLPASDGAYACFFNPNLYNSTAGEWNFTHDIWKMDVTGIQTRVNLTLPEDFQQVVPIRLGTRT